MHASNERKLIDVETLAGFMRKHPETIRRMARDGRLPSIKVDHEYRFDYTEIIEHFLRADILSSLDRISSDVHVPHSLRGSATTMACGLRDGSMSVDDIGNVIALAKETTC
jgi:hypothetical protein